jgi:hypothetical protein
MSEPSRNVRRAAIALIAIAGLALGAPAASATGANHQQRVHSVATFTFVNTDPVTYVGDHGNLTSVDLTTGALSILRSDGVTVSLLADTGACVRVDGLPAALSNLVIGQDVVTVSDATGTTALAVRAGHPVRLADEPGCGLVLGAVHGDEQVTMSDGSIQDRSWDRGRITGLTPGWIRILRGDGMSVVSQRTSETRVAGASSYWRLRLGERVAIVSLKTIDGQGITKLQAIAIRRHRG